MATLVLAANLRQEASADPAGTLVEAAGVFQIPGEDVALPLGLTTCNEW